METLSRLLFTFLLNALWQVILVTALTAIAVRLLQSAPARYRHALWVMGLGLAVLVPLMTLPDSWKLACRSATVGEATPSNSAPFPWQPSHRAGQPAGPRTELAQSLPAGAPGAKASPFQGAAAKSARGESRFLLLSPLRHRSRSIPVPAFYAYTTSSIYLFFLFCQLTRLARGWTSSRRLRRRARVRAIPEGLAVLVTRCQAALGLGSVAICGSSDVAGPATVGFFKPVIILPERLFQAAPSEDLTSALCHEMAHVRRHDYLLNLICEFVFLPLVFHPAAWLLKRRIDETRELACDEAAAERLLGPVGYARSLVSLAQSIAPLASAFRPRYTLGVFDANILEERIMRLLNKRPQVSPLCARLLMGGATLVLVLAAVAAGAFSLTALGNPQASGIPTLRTDFSGRWELDKSQSDLPSPAPDNLVEVIDQRGSELKVTTTSKDWNTSKMIAVTLFALMVPEFSTTTDNRETVQQFGPGQIRSKTRWEDNNLVTDWTLERNGQVAVTGRWVRHLSQDGQTQTVDITGHDPVHNLDGVAKAVFVRRDEDPRAFLGTWRGQFEGKTYILLSLKEANGVMSGAVSVGGFRINDSGQVVQVKAEADPQDATPVGNVKLEGELLSFWGKTPDGGSAVLFQMRLVGDSAAELKCRVLDPRAGTPAPGWWRLVRQSDDAQATVPGAGLLAGFVPGVPGGAVGSADLLPRSAALPVGVPGGIRGGIVGGVEGGVAGGIGGGIVGEVAGGVVGGL
jgi:beta-lactamase regulating signal transducer with metallopeptidase domain